MKKQLGPSLITIVVANLVLWTSGHAHADKLDDFREAAGKTGCEAIPYSSERSDCNEQQRRKNSTCRDFGCSRDQVEQLLEKLKEKRQSLADARSRKNESVVADLEATVAELEGDLRDRKAKAEQKINRCNDCITARERVQRVFSDTIAKVKGESDSALQEYIRILVEHFQNGAVEHVKPLDEVRAALSNCEWAYREINL